MSRTCKTAGDGKKDGDVCDIHGACESKLNLKCNDNGYCVFNTDGGHNSPCRTDTDCNFTKYPGLKCKQDGPGQQGTCDCTTQSKIADRCDENMICVGDAPGPSPSPSDQPPQNWPNGFAYNSADGAKFTGLCTDASSSWYKDGKGSCPEKPEGATLAGQPKAGLSIGCIPKDNWTAGMGDGYVHLCTIPAASAKRR